MIRGVDLDAVIRKGLGDYVMLTVKRSPFRSGQNHGYWRSYGNAVPVGEVLPEYLCIGGWDKSGRPKNKTMDDFGLTEFTHLL